MDLVVHPEKKDEQGRNGHCLAAFFTGRVILLYTIKMEDKKWKM